MISTIYNISFTFCSQGNSHHGNNNNQTVTPANEIFITTSNDIIATTYDVAVKVSNNWFSKTLEDLRYLVPVVWAIVTNLVIVILKKNTYVEKHMSDAMIWIYITSTILSLISMGILEEPVLPTNWLDTIYIIIHCLTFVFVWPLFMIACKYLSGNIISILVSTLVIFMLIPQYTILSDIYPGNKNWIEILGAILVLLGSILISLWELLKSNMKQ